MNPREEIDICINLINWIKDESISNEEILSRITINNYWEKAIFFDQNDSNRSKSLVRILKNIENVLTTADKTLPIHNQRYPCSYLTIVKRLRESCETLQLPADELLLYLQKSKDFILQLHLAEYIAKKLLLENDIQKTLNLVNFIQKKEYHYRIYREVAKYYALKGDKENFIKILKKCDGRQEVYQLEYIKEIFMENYASENSLETIFELIENKLFGKKYLVVAMEPFTKIKSFEEMKTIVDFPIFEDSKRYLKPIILTHSFTQNKANQTTENFEYLKILLDEIPAKIRYGNSDFSMRDNLWSSLAVCFLENDIQKFRKEWELCVKKINSKILKNGHKDLLENGKEFK